MTASTQKRRSLRLWLLAGLLLFSLCLAGAVYVVVTFPILGSTAVTNPPIIWRTLPTPTVAHPGWTNFSNAQKINDLARRDGLIWAASDGGLLVWQESTGGVEKFTSEHGLAENQTTSVAIGMDGVIWVGTASAGVSRYDGTAWQTFRVADGLPSDEVRDVAVTADGMVWVATAGGIGRYDGRRWFRYTRSRTLLQLPSDDVNSLAVDPDGRTLYAGTAAGVVRFNGRSWDSLAQVGSQAINDIQDVAVTPSGQLWAATAGGLLQYDSNSWQLYTTADGLAANDVRHLTTHPDGTVWLGYGAQGLGLTQFSVSSNVPSVTAVTVTDGLPNDQIFAILPASGGTWLGSGDGLILRQSSGSWQTFAAPSDIPSNQIVDLATVGGQPWLGSAAGVSRFNGATWELATDGLADTAVTSLSRDNSDQLWATFGSVGKGAAWFDFATNQWQAVGCPVSGPASPYVRHMVQTADGRLWLATEAGLASYDGRSRQWQLFTVEDGLPSDLVQALALGLDDTLWIGTNAGLVQWQDGRFTTLNQDDVREMAVSPDGTVWFITADSVWRLQQGQAERLSTPPVSQVFDVLATEAGFWLAAAEGVVFFAAEQPASGRWLRFTSADVLPGDRVTALAQAPDGTVWASSDLLPNEPPLSSGHYGTYTIQQNYLSFFDGRAWHAAVRPVPADLLHPVITSIVTTSDGTTWLASLAGVSRYKNGQWTAFTLLDGLPGYEIYQLLAVEQTVWAVTSGGLAQFNPATQQWKSFAGVGNRTNPEALQLATDGRGTVWAGSGANLLRYDGRDWQQVVIDLPAGDVTVYDFVVAEDGRLWLTAALASPRETQHLLATFDGTNWAWNEVQLQGGSQAAPLNNLWLALDGRLWASNNTGLWIFDLPTGNFTQPSQYPELIREITDLTFLPDGRAVAATRFSAAPRLLMSNGSIPLETPLEATHSYAIASGADGTIWLGTDQGAAVQQPDGRWLIFSATEAEWAQTVTELTVAQDGGLLLGMSGGDVLQVVAGQVLPITSTPSGSGGTPVSVLFEDADGQLWRGNFGGSVARLEGERWQLFPASPPIYAARVQDVAVSDEETIWLATAEELITITTVGERTVCQRDTAADYPQAAGLAADGQGRLWLTSERIVYRGDAAGFERIGTLALPITAVAPDGSIWYVTQTDLVRMRGDQRQPIPHNLPPDTLTALAISPDGTIWLGTTNGVAIFVNGQWRRLTAADGLAGNHVTHISFADDGSVWLATTSGVSRLRP